MNDTVRSFVGAEKLAGRNVTRACELLEVSRSAYYASIDRPPSQRARTDAELVERIAQIHGESRHTYGSPRIHAELTDAGVHVGRKRVARLMAAGGLVGRCRRRTRQTTIAGVEARARNIVNRVFGPGDWEIDQAWCGDVTYVRTWEGWAYLATVIDLASRRVVGWALADNMETDLVADALRMAIDARGPTAGLLFHSDRGSTGGFNRLSQHLGMMEVLGGSTAAASRPGFATGDAFAWPADPGPTGGTRVLAAHRRRQADGGRGNRDWRVHPCRVALVSSRWRHAALDLGRAHRPLPLLQRA
jgi:hypothetical protein